MRIIYSTTPEKIWVTFVCGVFYVLGMRLTLHVFATIGFTLSQPILSSVNVLVGTLLSAILGGVPNGLVPGIMLIACLLLLAAILTAFYAGRLRTQAQERDELQSALRFNMVDLWRSLGLLTLASILMPAYTLGLSYGLKSITQPVGLAVLPFMALLSAGAFSGAMLGSGLILTRRGLWRQVLKAPLAIHKFGIFSGLLHYGGNIIHTFATASLSSVISWPLGVTYTLWTLLWGILYGEFRGASSRTFLLLGLAVLLYLVGAYLVSIQA
jgi:glucose uptake protein GlcU